MLEQTHQVEKLFQGGYPQETISIFELVCISLVSFNVLKYVVYTNVITNISDNIAWLLTANVESSHSSLESYPP